MPLNSDEIVRQRQQLNLQILRYSGASADEYVRPSLGEQLAFEPLRSSIEHIIEVSKQLQALPIDRLPPRLVLKALGAYGNIEARMNELQTFDILTLGTQNQNPVAVRQSLISQFDQGDNPFWEQIAPVVSYLGALQVQSDLHLQGAREMMEQARTTMVSAKELQEQLSRIVEASRTAASEVGVSRYASLFATESAEHDGKAKRWLWATVIAATLTLAATVANVVFVISAAEDVQSGLSVQLVLAKVLIFSLLLSATIWCAKLYKAGRHNSVINRHRQNALGTFQAFVEGASDEQTKNAVLLYAAQSVFSPQSSGFIAGEQDTAGPAQLVELVRTVTQPAK